MGFEMLLGNRQLKENLQSSISRGRVSHFYLLCGPEGSGKKTLAKLLSAAILCESENKPCEKCAACRKVMGDAHPDVITVTDPEHKNVAVKIVRQVREEMFVRPNEADKKIYIFPQELGIEGQNALLKILEEPPSYGVFMLLTDNPEKLLPTVRSRCTELSLQSLPEDVLRQRLQRDFPDAAGDTVTAAIARSGGYLGQALALLENGITQSPQMEGFLVGFGEKKVMELVQVLVPMERWKRDQLEKELQQWAEVLQQALVCRSGMDVLSEQARLLSTQRSAQELLQALRHVQKAMEYAQSNVSPAAICGYLEWALR